MNSLGNAFNQAYATTDGWKEILAGMIIGGMGAPNINAIGSIRTKENGFKEFKPFSVDKEKSLWTGGVFGQFQDVHHKNMIAQQLIDDYNKQDASAASEHFNRALSQNQGIVSQIGDINHQNSLTDGYDAAVESGDHYTAKNLEDDKFHSFIKSRIDSGYYDSLESELVKPIKDMTDDEFKESFGYGDKLISNEELSDRKRKTIEQARKSIKNVKEAISTVDSVMDVDLSKEDNRLHRDLLIYALSTNKSVGDRIESISKSIKDTIKDQAWGQNLQVLNDIISRDKESLATETDSDKIKLLKKRIEDTEENISKIKNLEAELPTSVIGMKEFAKEAKERYVNKAGIDDGSKEDFNQSLDDLVKLMRRKVEAIELYNTMKDPKAFNNLYRTERIDTKIRQWQEEALQKIVDSQNEEIAKAKDHVDNGGDPIEAQSISGAEINNIQKIVDNKNLIDQLDKAKTDVEFLKVINSNSEKQYDNIDDFLEDVTDAHQSGVVSDEELAAINKLYGDIYTSSYLYTKKPVQQTPDKLESKGSLQKGNPNNSVLGKNTVSQVENEANNVDKTLGESERKSTNNEGEKLFDAYDHIAWLGMSYDISEGKFIDKGVNKDASKITLDFKKLNKGDKITFEVVYDDAFMPGKSYTDEELTDFVTISIKKDGEIVGYVHKIDYIREDRIIKTDSDGNDNLERNKEELRRFRSFIIKNKG